MRWISRGIAALLFVMLWGSADAQQAREVFGKNRIQYKNFDWSYLSSENFDVHFYGSRRKVAEEALQYLESEFDRITDLLGFYPYQKTKVFLYNSITDLQQSNMGLNANRYSAGGETEFIKPYVEIAHPGNLDEFKEELIYKMSDLMVNQMMFGGNLKDVFQNSVLLNLPEWFIEGTSYYVAKGWDEEMDDYARQLVKSNRAKKALKMSGKEAALVGQSIWNYIVEKYGKSSINNILNYTRIIRNEEKSILITLGVPFKQLMVDWRVFYGTIENKIEQSYVSVSDSLKFSGKHRDALIYTTVKISPDGKKIAYAENYRGKFKVIVKSLENGQESIILRGGNTVIKQTVDYRVPLLNWADANTLGVIGVKDGQYIFWLYDLTTKTKLPRELDKFSNIRSFSFSNNGRLVIVSADFEGQNDLFLLASRRDRTKRLTNDKFDDLDPSFIPNSNTVVFSSNRVNDSLKAGNTNLQKITANYNLFLFNIDTTLSRLTRVTNTLSRDFHARAIDEHNFFYLSDQRGITNLFRYNSQSGIYSQLTNFNSSIKEYDINYENKTLALVLNQRLREDIFVDKGYNFDRQIFTPATRRKEVLQARVFTERKKKEQAKITSIKDLINTRRKEKTDTIAQKQKPEIKKDTVGSTGTTPVKKDSNNSVTVNTDNYSFDDPAPTVKKDSIPAKKEVPAVKEKSVNTDDYVFEEEAVKAKQPSETFLTRYLKARETTRVKGPFPYTPKFSYENLVSSFVVDALRGWSIRLETQMNDMLENYRIYGGLQVAFADFKSGDVYGEFQYLPKRFDFSVRFDRKVVFWKPPNQGVDFDIENQKYSFQKIELGASYPISVRTRVTFKPFVGYTRFDDLVKENPLVSPPTFQPTKIQMYTGAKLEAVYDNSLATGMNIIEGTRGKIGGIFYLANGNNSKSFSQMYADVRHYQKIYKEIVFAVRGYAGSFFGNSPKNYVLGGMDNWIGNQFNYDGTLNPFVSKVGSYNENLLFTEFATSLRGFDYGTLYGNSVALANAELRVPLIRALSSGPITSNFFRNLQFTAFYDIGSSWTGPIPLNNENNGRTRTVPEKPGNSPFIAEIKEYLNPWLYSYGLGFRSIIFGYYIKIDLAWPVENYTVKNPRAHVTLGFDF